MGKGELELFLDLMNYVVNYDQWDVEGKNWMRVYHLLEYKEGFSTPDDCLIIFGDWDVERIHGSIAGHLVKVGERKKAREFKAMLGLN